MAPLAGEQIQPTCPSDFQQGYFSEAERWLVVYAPTPAYSITDELLWTAAPGEWYRVLMQEGGWALAFWEGDPPEWSVWIEVDDRVLPVAT